MKKLLAVLTLCVILFSLPFSALAWAPERFYNSLEELPSDVRAYLDTYLLPGETMNTAHKNGNYIMLLSEKQEERRLHIFEQAGDVYSCIFASLVLPNYRGLMPGITSGSDSVTLKYSDNYHFSFHRFGSEWLLSYVYAEDEFTVQAFSLVKSWHISKVNPYDVFPTYGVYTGKRSLRGISEADLPVSYADAVSKLDTANIAVVNNPNPKDRLHLRVRPNRDSDSLGKFYTGTPVLVLERKGDWACVRLGHLEGWMMRQFLAEGKDRERIRPAFLHWSPKEDIPPIVRYTRPDKGSMDIPSGDWGSQYKEIIIGVVEDKWLILMNDAGAVCYVPMDTYWPGNG